MANKTKICKYCRTEIDAKASICPNCKKKQGIGCLPVALIIFGLGFIGILATPSSKTEDRGSVTIPGDSSQQSAEIPTETTEKTNDENSENESEPDTSAEDSISDENEATLEETAEEENFAYELTDSRFSYYTNSIGTVEYYGIIEITNTGSTSIYLDDCTFDLEDNEGHLLQSDDWISSCPDIIAPGEKGYFYNGLGSTKIDSSVSFDNGINLVPNYKLEKATGEIKDFEVSDTDMRIDDYGNIKITGRVTNDTDKDNSIYLNVIFYNSDGKVLMITGTNVTGLDANTTVSFECTTMFSDDSVNKDDIATYQVIARDSYYQW